MSCQQNAPSPKHLIQDNGIKYLNTDPSVEFVGSNACYDCHPDIYDAYTESEMGHSMEKLTARNVLEEYPQNYTVYDSVLNFYYEMFTEDGRFFQREFRKNEKGEITHERIVEAEYALGSGNNLRMYFFNEGGMLYEMPLTWYTHKKKWDLSPGYREYQNLRFSRFATERCIACHNSFLKPNPKAVDRYVEPFQLGVGCERCHGPGALHVEEKSHRTLDLSENERTIINPRMLSRQRQLDVCAQCHLQGKAWAIHPEKHTFDFRPGMLLSNHRSVYYSKKTSTQVFEVADSAQRLALSKCFQGSDMTCITCHNPHFSIKTFSASHYNDKCLGCHETGTLPENTYHQRDGNCISCHMKSTGTANTLHGVTTTDHWIRINASETKIDWTTLRLPDKQKPIITLQAEVDVEDGNQAFRKSIAYFDYYKERDPRKAYLDSALVYLQAAKVKSSDANDFYKMQLLGNIHLELGNLNEALKTFKKCVDSKKAATDHVLFFDLAKINKKLGRYDSAKTHIRTALNSKPESPEYLELLGDLLNRTGDTDLAIKILHKALSIDRQNPNTFYLLGNIHALKLNDPRTALVNYLDALKLAPDFPRLNLNIGNTYARLQKYQQAILHYNKEIKVSPTSTDALLNLGQIYARTGDISNARRVLQQALKLDANLHFAQQLLNRLPSQ